MTAIVTWHPEPLTARLKAAMYPAVRDFERAAQAKAPGNIKVVARVTGQTATVSSPNREAIFVEKGARPHEIRPRGNVLRLADGRFVTGAVRHPGMRAQPFLRPTLALWPSLYRRHAMGATRGGFGGFV